MSAEQSVALVTGASRGIGKAIATTLGQAGHYVVGTATTPSGAQSITTYLSEQGLLGEGRVLDVCDQSSVDEVLNSMKSSCGMPVVLVNNAGITRDNILLRMKESQWHEVIDTNLNALYRVTKACAKSMFRARYGRIINITSVVGVSGSVGQSNYCAAKAGVIGFTKASALEFAAYGVTVNAVAPGFIETEMTAQLPESVQASILSKIPVGSIGRVEDVADAVCFLSKKSSAYITGETLHVNGGMCMV